jgi:hypothetical protein
VRVGSTVGGACKNAGVPQVRFIKSGTKRQLSYTCPWCDSAGIADHYAYRSTDAYDYTVLECPEPTCRQFTLIRAAKGALTHDSGTIAVDTYPADLPQCRLEGLPNEICDEFTEALRCQAHGFLLGAALVGRRVLQKAVRDRGGTGRNLQAEIDSLPDAVLSSQLKAHAHEVTADDARDLIDFTELVLQHLYTMPHRLNERIRRRTPPSGAP